MDHGAGDGDALLLAAGKLARVVLAPASEAHQIKHGPRRTARPGAGNPIEQEGDAGVFYQVQGGDEIELLKDKTDVATAEVGDLAPAHFGKFLPQHDDAAFVRKQGAGDNGKQGGFPTARGAGDELKFPWQTLKIRAFQGHGAGRAPAKTLENTVGGDGYNRGEGGWHGRII